MRKVVPSSSLSLEWRIVHWANCESTRARLHNPQKNAGCQPWPCFFLAGRRHRHGHRHRHRHTSRPRHFRFRYGAASIQLRLSWLSVACCRLSVGTFTSAERTMWARQGARITTAGGEAREWKRERERAHTGIVQEGRRQKEEQPPLAPHSGIKTFALFRTSEGYQTCSPHLGKALSSSLRPFTLLDALYSYSFSLLLSHNCFSPPIFVPVTKSAKLNWRKDK